MLPANRIKEHKLTLMNTMRANPDDDEASIIKKSGIDPAEYYSMIDDPDFFKELFKFAKLRIFAPSIAGVLQKIEEKARAGDAQFVKLYLELAGEKQPDGQMQMNLVNLTDEELRARIDMVKEELDETKVLDSETIDVEYSADNEPEEDS